MGIRMKHPDLDSTIEVGTEAAARVHQDAGWFRTLDDDVVEDPPADTGTTDQPDWAGDDQDHVPATREDDHDLEES